MRVDRVQDPVDAVPPRGGHDRLALRLVRRVQRQREAHARLVLAELPDALDDADRRHRDAARAQREVLRVEEEPAGADHAVVVVQGLAHAHEDDISCGRLQRPRDEDLLHDLAAAQVAAVAHRARGAERAGHRAADLRRHAAGDARRPQRRVAHDNGLDLGAVAQLDDDLRRRAVLGVVARRHARAPHGERVFEKCRQLLGHAALERGPVHVGPGRDLRVVRQVRQQRFAVAPVDVYVLELPPEQVHVPERRRARRARELAAAAHYFYYGLSQLVFLLLLSHGTESALSSVTNPAPMHECVRSMQM